MSKASGEIKGLIVVITFLSTFFIVTALIPSGFLYEEPEYRQVSVPQYFEAIDIQSFANTYNLNLSNTWQDYKFTLGGWNVNFEYWNSQRGFACRTYSSWWIFNWEFDNFRWFDYEGIERSKHFSITFQTRELCYLKDVDQAYEDAGNNGLRWILRNDHTQFILYFGFNETAYDSPSKALQNDDLHVLLCVNFDKVNTTFNAWNLIGSLLFFQMPDIHPVINALISIPIWILMAYLIYVLILKAIPFVGGG